MESTPREILARSKAVYAFEDGSAFRGVGSGSSGFGAQGFGSFRVPGSRVWGLGSRVSGLGV